MCLTLCVCVCMCGHVVNSFLQISNISVQLYHWKKFYFDACIFSNLIVQRKINQEEDSCEDAVPLMIQSIFNTDLGFFFFF